MAGGEAVGGMPNPALEFTKKEKVKERFKLTPAFQK
jgi:hypothetical protein